MYETPVTCGMISYPIGGTFWRYFVDSCEDTVEDSTVNCPNTPSTYCGTSPGFGPVKVFSSLVLMLESDSQPVVHPLIHKFKCFKKGLPKKEF